MFDNKEMEEMEEMEEFVDGLVELASITIDKIIEKDIPMKTARVMKVYNDAYVEVGFSRDEAVQMVIATIKSQAFNNKN